MLQSCFRSFLVSALLAAATNVLWADGPTVVRSVSLGRRPAPTSGPEIRIDTNLVLIPVMVADRLNRPVIGLVKEDFKLFDQNIEQEIRSFSSEEAPVSIGIVFDCSRSMENKLGKSRAAVAQFLQAANRQDEFFLVQFSDRAQLIQPFTTHTDEIQNRLALTEARGATALLDAIRLAILEIRRARNPRKALLIISDGADNNSRHSLREVRNLLKESDAQIFAIGLSDAGGLTEEDLAGLELLERIAEQTGGREYPVGNFDELPAIAQRIGEALRYLYVIGYVPRTLPYDGKYRRIEVKLIWRRGSTRLLTSWRHGYYAPLE